MTFPRPVSLPGFEAARVAGVHVERAGTGPPLLLLHGLGSHTGMWAPVVPRLVGEREVIAVDLPGFGRSPELDGVAPTPAALAGAVAAVLEELGHETAHVAGNSLGGWVALELGRTGRARSIVCLSPAGFWNTPSGWFGGASLRMSRVLARGIVDVAPRLLASPRGRAVTSLQLVRNGAAIPVEDALEAAWMLAHAPGFRATIDAARDRHYERAELRCPVTIAWGENDRLLLPRRQLRTAAEMVPTARLAVLRGCGHVPTWDDAEQVAEVLLSYGG